MRRDRRQDGAAYPDAKWRVCAGASRRVIAPETREGAYVASRDTLQAFAGVAVLRRPAYPAAEFYAALKPREENRG